MKSDIKIRKFIKPALCGLCLILTGCSAASLAQEDTFESAYENSGEEEPINIYTASAPVIIESVDEGEQTISLYLTDRDESGTFYYDGATVIQDKYGSSMSMTQLRAGDIADITYNSELEKVGSITLSGEAWSYEGVVKYDLDVGNGSAAIGNDYYSLDGNVQVFSEEQTIETSQIIHQDVLSFHGKGSDIMSITVDKGHGYLELINDEAVLGGWIEVGQAVISQIAPDMLLTVPEGSYTVRLTAEGIDESREVTIERDKETVLDLWDIEPPEPEKGIVVFDVVPSSAKVYVDDMEVNTAYPIRLDLGIHQAMAEASGYETLSEYFKVEGEKTTVKMELNEKLSLSGNSIPSSKQENATITIEGPKDVDVYQDNLYMGVAPITYDKTAGEHTITLRKTGYITRSYTINVADDGKDVTYSFPDLDPEDGSTVSGNAINTNGTTTGTVSGNEIAGDKKKTATDGRDNTVSGNTVSGDLINDTTDENGNVYAREGAEP